VADVDLLAALARCNIVEMYDRGLDGKDIDQDFNLLVSATSFVDRSVFNCCFFCILFYLSHPTLMIRLAWIQSTTLPPLAFSVDCIHLSPPSSLAAGKAYAVTHPTCGGSSTPFAARRHKGLPFVAHGRWSRPWHGPPRSIGIK
jgi:hypothetical protein